MHLCLILTRALCSLDPLRVLTESIEGGVDLVQVREKEMTARELLAWSRKILEIARPLGVPVVINDSVEVALASGADGVHLGQDDLPVHEARSLLGENKLIGLSTHDLEQVDDAAEQGVDYIGFGPVYATATKGYEVGLGAEKATTAAILSRVPMLAIGGITVENSWMIPRKAGIAVSSALCAAHEPGRIAQTLRASDLY